MASAGHPVFGLNPSHPDSIGIRGTFDDDPDGIEVDLVGGNHEPRVGQRPGMSPEAGRYEETIRAQLEARGAADAQRQTGR